MEKSSWPDVASLKKDFLPLEFVEQEVGDGFMMAYIEYGINHCIDLVLPFDN